MNAPTMDVRFKHVTSRRNKNGTVRYYFLRRGQPLRALPGKPGDIDFAEAYQSALNWSAPAATVSEGTFAWLCDQYMDSAEFKGKAAATRAARRRVILSMTREPIDPKFPETFGMERAHKIGRRHILTLRDRKAANPNAANERLKILSQIFKLAVGRGWRDDNPVRDVPRLPVPRGGHDTATDADIEAYLSHHTAGPAWLAMMLLKNTGIRVSDLRILGRQHLRSGFLIFDTVKTGVRCELELSTELRAALPRSDMTFLLSDHRKPFASDKALSQRIAKWFRQAGIEGKTAHSVRKWLATKMADNGATEMQLMAWFGWRDPKEARPYVQAANRRQMASQALARITNV